MSLVPIQELTIEQLEGIIDSLQMKRWRCLVRGQLEAARGHETHVHELRGYITARKAGKGDEYLAAGISAKGA